MINKENDPLEKFVVFFFVPILSIYIIWVLITQNMIDFNMKYMIYIGVFFIGIACFKLCQVIYDWYKEEQARYYEWWLEAKAEMDLKLCNANRHVVDKENSIYFDFYYYLKCNRCGRLIAQKILSRSDDWKTLSQTSVRIHYLDIIKQKPEYKNKKHLTKNENRIRKNELIGEWERALDFVGSFCDREWMTENNFVEVIA